MKKNNYEILAPAGSFDAFEAAVKAGANAVYLGGEKFSARSRAHNFSNEDLIKTVEYAHKRGVKIYVTTNILIDDSEMEDAINFVKFLYEIGVDAIIVQDVGFSLMVKRLFEDFEVHASTQMAINNLYGAKTIEEFGFSRVVLARETELVESKLIRDNTSLEIEGFVHGALCVCISGECLMSSMIGGRSGNRGDCAQPCRKSYKIIGLDSKEIASEKYFISPKDLNTLNDIQTMIDSGIYSLKIEGRMKKPEYVYQIVSSYKKAIEDELEEKDLINTEQIFSRGFTKGLFNGDFGNKFITADRPDNRGREIGFVKSKKFGGYILELKDRIVSGDGLEFYSLESSFGINSNFSAEKGEYFFQSERNIPLGSKIYKTFSKELNDNINIELNRDIEYRNIDMLAVLKVSKKPKLIAKCDNISVEVSLEDLVQEAQKKPLTKEKIVENLSKLGGTIYNLNSLVVECDDSIFMPISQLNELRRKAIGELDRQILLINRKNVNIDHKLFEFENVKNKSEDKINVEFSNFSDIITSDLSKVNRVYFPIDRLKEKDIDYLRTKGLKIGGVFRKFQSSKELEMTKEIITSNIDIFEEVLMNNLSQISIMKDVNIKKVADIGLNVFNSYTVKELLKLGFNRVILSPELNHDQIENILSKYGDKVEVLCHGLIPVMTMVHCPMSVELGCKDSSNCDKCKYARGFFLEDGRESRFLVEREKGISQIYNNHPIMLGGKISPLKKFGLSNFKLNLREDINETVDMYDSILKKRSYDETNIKNTLIEKYQGVTNGHYNRGILNG